MIGSKSPEVIVWNMNRESETVNIFQKLRTHVDIFSTFCKNSNSFCCAVKYNEFAKKKSFENQNLGRNSLRIHVLCAFEACNFQGEKVLERMAVHGLQETVIFQLVEAGHWNAAKAICSRYCDHCLFTAYQDLCDRLVAKNSKIF